MMQTRGLELIDAPIYVNCYTLFTNEEKYGQSIKVKHGKESEVLPGLMPAIQAQLIVPQATGDLILMRQQYLLQSLIIIIEDILETAISLEDQTKHGKKSDEVAIKAMAMLSVHSTTEVTGLPQLLVSSLECSLALEDYTNLLTTEPTVLASEVNFWFFTRPELVPDEKGQRLPVHTDRYISEALRPGIDLGDFAIPIDNLLQPDMATGALARLDEYFLDKTGTRMGLLYQDLVNDSTTKIRGLLEQRKAESGQELYVHRFLFDAIKIIGGSWI
ncbi:hypothetical protein N0V95_000515, partial [Ascochyta clinopodiicola]